MPINNYQYRIKLTKLNELKYISHLDFQNLILKTLRRADCDLELTEGFSPTPKISFSPALPIFIESECEFINISLKSEMEKNFKEKFEENTNKNMKIKDIFHYPPSERKLESLDILLQWAEYEAKIRENKKDICNLEKIRYNIEKYLSSDNLFIKKINKKGIEKNIDFKPSIKELKLVEDKILFTLKTGQGEIPAMRADEFLRAVFEDEKLFNTKRTRFFDKDLQVL